MIIRKQYLEALAGVVSDDSSRYAMALVQVDPTAHTLTATDGHILVEVTDPSPWPMEDWPSGKAPILGDEPTAPALIPPAAAKLVPKQGRGALSILSRLCVTQSDVGIECAGTNLEMVNRATYTTQDQQFPDTAHVWPKAPATWGIVLGVEALGDLLGAAKKLGLTSLRFEGTGGRDVLTVRGYGNPEADVRGLIMPYMHHDDKTDPLPQDRKPADPTT